MEMNVVSGIAKEPTTLTSVFELMEYTSPKVREGTSEALELLRLRSCHLPASFLCPPAVT